LVGLQLTSDGRVADALEGTQVFFDSVPAPMIYTSAAQISAIAPFAIAGQHTTTLTVQYAGQTSAGTQIPVALASPGVFTINASGQGQAAALNEDYSINGEATPAAPGSVITVYVTGAGQTSPASSDGSITTDNTLPVPAQSVTALLGGITADVLYAGGAPGIVSGVVQVNIKIPEASLNGPIPLLIDVGGTQSQAGVTVWIAGT
jgi:uncharacterized protein (TIGR03437 family)